MLVTDFLCMLSQPALVPTLLALKARMTSGSVQKAEKVAWVQVVVATKEAGGKFSPKLCCKSLFSQMTHFIFYIAF